MSRALDKKKNVISIFFFIVKRRRLVANILVRGGVSLKRYLQKGVQVQVRGGNGGKN